MPDDRHTNILPTASSIHLQTVEMYSHCVTVRFQIRRAVAAKRHIYGAIIIRQRECLSAYSMQTENIDASSRCGWYIKVHMSLYVRYRDQGRLVLCITSLTFSSLEVRVCSIFCVI